MKALVLNETRGRPLFCGETRPVCADLTQARQTGSVAPLAAAIHVQILTEVGNCEQWTAACASPVADGWSISWGGCGGRTRLLVSAVAQRAGPCSQDSLLLLFRVQGARGDRVGHVAEG